jgi:hypothetical protein
VSLVDLSLVVDVLVADGVGIREAMRVPESEREDRGAKVGKSWQQGLPEGEHACSLLNSQVLLPR